VTMSDGGAFPVSELQRSAALASLVHACSTGQLTLAEFSERSDLVLTATSDSELASATAELPSAPLPPRALRRVWLVPFGNRVHRGRFVLPARATAIVAVGEVHLDVRQASLLGHAAALRLYVLMGNLRLLVPRAVRVEIETSSLLGGRTLRTVGPEQPTTTISVRMFDVIGNVKVTDDPDEWHRSFQGAR
jgi:hypothetical protein